MGEQLIILHTRALQLLSECSRYVPERLQDEIEQLANDTSRCTLMPVRVERTQDMVVIDALNVPG